MASLRLRLAVGAFVLIGAALVVTWQSLSLLFAREVEREHVRELSAVMDGLVANVAFDDGGAPVLGATPVDQRYVTAAGGRYWQIADDGRVVLRSRSLWDAALAVGETGGRLVPDEGPDGLPVVRLSRIYRFEVAGTERPLLFAVAATATDLDGAKAAFSRQLAIMLAITALLLGLAAAVQIAAGLRPLGNLRKAVADIRSGRSDRLPETGPSELAPLVAETNALLAEREEAVVRARARAADLAHGLKTPLTVLAHVADTLAANPGQAGHGEAIAGQVDVIRARVDRQLALARIRRGPGLATPLGPLVDRIVRALAPVAASRGITITTEVGSGVVIAADETDAAEAIGNIIDNALGFARHLIAVTAARDAAGRIILAVRDDGPGIPAPQRAIALGRGGRLDETRPGHGFGLAIAADIMAAVGGTIALGGDDGGLVVELGWPPA